MVFRENRLPNWPTKSLPAEYDRFSRSDKDSQARPQPRHGWYIGPATLAREPVSLRIGKSGRRAVPLLWVS